MKGVDAGVGANKEVAVKNSAGGDEVIVSNEVTNPQGLGIFRLVTTVITLIIGSGIFIFVGDVAAVANTGAVLTGWAISLAGVFCLMMCFYGLSRLRPELKGGIYSYASAGFGDYMGFNSAWGYWISALLTPVSYIALLFAILSNFFPIFGEGTNLASLICASIILWFYVFLVSRGIKEVTGINAVITIGKIVPILTVVVLILVMQKFDLAIFLNNFWGEAGGPDFFEQVKGTLIVTIWVFIGVEGAVAISGRARKASDVGRATTISFACVCIIYLAVSLLSMGVMPREQLAELASPSLAGVLEAVIGPAGSTIVSIGLIISLAGALLGYIVLSSETPHEAATEGVFPTGFAKVNKHGAPIVTLLVTAALIQGFLILMLFSSATYQFFYTISVGMILIPYLLSSAYFLKLVFKKDALNNRLSTPCWKWRIVAIVGVLYSIFLMYATGLSGLVITAILYAPGVFVYILGKRERGQLVFKKLSDKVILTVILVLFVAAIILFATGQVELFG